MFCITNIWKTWIRRLPFFLRFVEHRVKFSFENRKEIQALNHFCSLHKPARFLETWKRKKKKAGDICPPGIAYLWIVLESPLCPGILIILRHCTSILEALSWGVHVLRIGQKGTQCDAQERHVVLARVAELHLHSPVETDRIPMEQFQYLCRDLQNKLVSKYLKVILKYNSKFRVNCRSHLEKRFRNGLCMFSINETLTSCVVVYVVYSPKMKALGQIMKMFVKIQKSFLGLILVSPKN